MWQPASSARSREREVGLRRGGDVEDVGALALEQGVEVVVMARDAVAQRELLGDQQLAVGDRDDPRAALEVGDLLRVGLGDLAAAYDRDLQGGRGDGALLSRRNARNW